MKPQDQISPQRHRDTENTKANVLHLLPDEYLSLISRSCFSLCLCVSVVEVFQ